eukprot:scaffold72893_cov58-Attheya_sp.AAC.2
MSALPDPNDGKKEKVAAEQPVHHVVASETTPNETCKYTVDDLTELVGAVRFAHPDASMRKVHREISEQMSQQESFEFLKEVELKEVKKVWKRATKTSSSNNNNNNNNTPSMSASSTVHASLLEAAAKTSDDGVLKFYTVGDASVKTLATEYAAQAAAKEHGSASTSTTKTKQQAEAAEDLGNYVHVFLDVPADRSGARPHQAIINFNTTNNADDGAAAKSTNRAERRQQARNSKGKAPTSAAAASDNEKGVTLVKIQVAASNADEDASMKHPMLLYNQDRTARTFIHPPSTDDDDDDDDDDTYDKIHALIVTQGIGGALGMIGGTKGYMYSRITKRDSGQQDIISINTSKGLAPTPSPTW